MSERHSIERQIAVFIHAFEAGDLSSLMSTYTADLLKARNGFPDETRDETEQRLKTVFEKFERSLTVQNDEIEVFGEFAYVRGRLQVELRPKAGGPAVEIRRRFLELWRKEDGTWRVARTMDNVTE